MLKPAVCAEAANVKNDRGKKKNILRMGFGI
jgi:hypothetical protein